MLAKALSAVAIALLLPLIASAQSTQPALAGQWVVRVVPLEQSREKGATESDHVLLFGSAEVTVQGPLGEGFGPAAYETMGRDFRLIHRHEKLGTVLWTGELEDDFIRGLIRWTRKDGHILTYRFAGERATPPQ
jgi:hypothetical protein